MASSVIGALRVNLGLDSAQFLKGAKNAQNTAQRLGKNLQKIGAAVSAVGVGVTLAVRGQLNAADDLGKAAQKIGIPVEALSQLKFAASQAGVEMSVLERGVRNVGDRMVRESKKFEDIGVAVRNTDGTFRPVLDVFEDTAEVLSQMEDGAEKTATAMALFGQRSGPELIPLLNAGKNGIRAMRDEADALGLTISEDTARAAEQFNDNISRIGAQITGIFRQITADIAPILAQISDVIVAVAAKFRELPEPVRQFGSVAAALTVVIGPLLVGLGLMVTVLGAISAPVLAVVAGVTALTAAAVAFWPEIVAAKDALIGLGRDGIEFVKTKFDELIGFFTGLPQRMVKVGEDLIEGLKQGILRRWEAIKAEVLDIPRALTEGFKNFWQVRSPSRVFRGIGEDLMSGLAIGVNDGTGNVVGALATLNDNISSTLDSVGGTFSAVGGSFGDMVADIVTGSREIGDVLSDLGNQLLRSGINDLVGGIFSGGGLGNIFSGFFDSGGFIPRGQFGIAGERGPEIVTGPANVTSRVDTARMLGGGGGRVEVVARVENGNIVQTIREVSGNVAVRVMSEGLAEYDRSTLPGSVSRINKDPRRVG